MAEKTEKNEVPTGKTNQKMCDMILRKGFDVVAFHKNSRRRAGLDPTGPRG